MSPSMRERIVDIIMKGRAETSASTMADAIIALLTSDETIERLDEAFSSRHDTIDDWETMMRHALTALFGDKP